MQQSIPPGLICARLLGYMLIHVSNDDGHHNATRDITSCVDDAKPLKVVQLYFNHFVCSCEYFQPCQIPTTPSDHPSRLSFDKVGATINHALEESPRDRSTAKAKCLMSGACEVTVFMKLVDFRNAVEAQPHTSVSIAEAAHIFPAFNDTNIFQVTTFYTHYTSSVWATIDRFAGFNIFEELDGSDINHLEDILTLRVDMHGLFDALVSWFEKKKCVAQCQDTLDTSGLRRKRNLPIATTVSFTTIDPVRLPLPSPDSALYRHPCHMLQNDSTVWKTRGFCSPTDRPRKLYIML
ncbi:hypothetical protein K503DRAFT_691754 [Rhizopogon vinicolor AM-OR11-026]|uniref:HNH nuclease domain-containing protein n=1 Tax=Rhizopogon vinicolor AM-OR11-026 TaxID=1314800 RepID=A0A1B7N0F7_9AGAM|nr:hypothetical protein K503DRAFT_691754 [Rhizopogon vinicolor AM-OR11-026]